MFEMWEPKPPGTLWATLGLLQDSFTFFFINISAFVDLRIVLYTLTIGAAG
jgi:hypothetical protein